MTGMGYRTRKRQPWDKLYKTSRWLKLRAKVLLQQPFCIYCLQHGVYTATQVIDHIKPHKGNEALMWDKTNLQGLCKYCHDSRKQREEQEESSRAKFRVKNILASIE